MTTTRWEKERGAWVMARSRPGTSKRRRAELIGRRGRRLSRGGAGVAESSLREDVTPPLVRRMMTTDEGPGETLSRLVLVPVAFIAIGLVVGPALALGSALYGLMWLLAGKIGRLWSWPWHLAALAVFAAGVLGLDFTGALTLVPWPLGLEIAWAQFLTIVFWFELSVGLMFTGVLISWSGWAAVGADAAPRAEKDKDGNFKATPDHKKIRLDANARQRKAKKTPEPEGTENEKPKTEKPTESPSIRPKTTKLAKLTAESMRGPSEADDEPDPDDEPVFADEDDEDFGFEPQESPTGSN